MKGRFPHLTWARALLGGVLAFGVLFGATAIYLQLNGGAVSSELPPPSIAVLPFVNTSGDEENDYFSDGLAEELINALSRVPGLKVAARTSAFAFKGKGADVRTVARELGVRTVLEGSVQKAGDHVRIRAQLVNAADGFDLWSASYDRALHDIFAVQDEIARSIVGALKVTLTGQGDKPLVAVSTRNFEAYEEYLRGRFFWEMRKESTIRSAIEHFERAMALDSTYAVAYAGLADAHAVLPLYVSLDAASWRATLRRAEAAAERALELDPTMPQPYAALGFVRHFRLDWTGAERAYRHALELDPAYATAHHWYAITLASTGRLEDSLREIQTAQRLDPLSIVIRASFAYVLFLRRDYAGAIRQCEAAIELDPSFPSAWFILGMAHLQRGSFEDAARAWKRWATAAGRDTLKAAQFAHLAAEHAATGLPAKLPVGFEPELPVWEQSAGFHAVVGHPERAVSELYESYRVIEEGGGWFQWGLRVHPWYDPLRSDDRFIEFQREIGVQP